MLRDVVRWWLTQISTLLPRRLRAERQPDALLISVGAGGVSLVERRRGRERRLGDVPAEQAAIRSALTSQPRRPRLTMLRVAADVLLERPVELPLAAERDLHRVLGYEMDRLTPFAPDDVVWQAVETARDRTARRLRLRLALVPRRRIDPMLRILSRAGIAVDWLEVAAPDGMPRLFPLNASVAATRETGMTALAIVAGTLALAVVATPFLTQTLAMRAVDRQIADLSPRVARVQALRRHLAADAAGSDVFATERAKVGDVLQVLAATTRVIPDGAWLTELSLHQGKLRISGQSPAAAGLIPALAQDPHFRNPAFAAPVTRVPDGHTDMFSINAGFGS